MTMRRLRDGKTFELVGHHGLPSGRVEKKKEAVLAIGGGGEQCTGGGRLEQNAVQTFLRQFKQTGFSRQMPCGAVCALLCGVRRRREWVGRW